VTVLSALAGVCLTLAAPFQPGSFRLSTLEGAEVEFASLRGRVTVVVFVSAVCPMANDYADRFTSLWETYQQTPVRFVFINSNRNESAAEIRANAAGNRFPFPVHRDPSGLAAERFQAEVTPTAYVLDTAGAIRYQGAIDDAANPARVKRSWVREAVEALLAGRTIETTATKPSG
jgi:peroxiredoxin